jgi:hypothetical protein
MKQFIKEKYNILIPVFLGVVILIALFLYGREYRNNRNAYEKEQDVYQYFSKNKIEYKATTLNISVAPVLRYQEVTEKI